MAGSMDIRVTGLKEALEALGAIDREIPKELKRGLREDAKPLLQAAKGYASGLGGTGAYSASLTMRTVSAGVRIRSGDPGAGVIEFANPGALAMSGPRRGKRVGVPGGNPPRALVKSAIEHEDELRDKAESRIAEVIGRYLNG